MQRHAIKRFTVGADQFYPIVAPISCNYWTVRCDSSALLIRTDPNDATTEDTILAQAQEGVTSCIGSPAGALVDAQEVPESYRGCRYRKGDAVCYLKAASGTPTVVGQFVY